MEKAFRSQFLVPPPGKPAPMSGTRMNPDQKLKWVDKDKEKLKDGHRTLNLKLNQNQKWGHWDRQTKKTKKTEMRSTCSPFWNTEHKTLRGQLTKESSEGGTAAAPQGEEQIRLDHEHSPCSNRQKWAPRKGGSQAATKQGWWSSLSTTLGARCRLGPGLFAFWPYLPLGVVGDLAQSQWHRLWEQVRNTVVSSSEHCCKLL